MQARQLFGAILTLAISSAAQAGVFEISANGSYFKYNNGVLNGDTSYTTTQRATAGIAYRFLQNTSIEVSLTSSKNTDEGTLPQLDVFGAMQKLAYKKITDFNNLALNLILDVTDRNATFRPYISGGVGYMVKFINVKTTLNGGSPQNYLTPVTKSASADVGLGLKIFVANSVAIDLSGTVLATDLDKPEIYLHYSLSGGLRFLF